MSKMIVITFMLLTTALGLKMHAVFFQVEEKKNKCREEILNMTGNLIYLCAVAYNITSIILYFENL